MRRYYNLKTIKDFFKEHGYDWVGNVENPTSGKKMKVSKVSDIIGPCIFETKTKTEEGESVDIPLTCLVGNKKFQVLSYFKLVDDKDYDLKVEKDWSEEWFLKLIDKNIWNDNFVADMKTLIYNHNAKYEFKERCVRIAKEVEEFCKIVYDKRAKLLENE